MKYDSVLAFDEDDVWWEIDGGDEIDEDDIDDELMKLIRMTILISLANHWAPLFSQGQQNINNPDANGQYPYQCRDQWQDNNTMKNRNRANHWEHIVPQD